MVILMCGWDLASYLHLYFVDSLEGRAICDEILSLRNAAVNSV